MEPALAFAEAALARGDYNQCLKSLGELSEKHPLNSSEGGKVRMLMITAWMGKGDNEKAKSICRQLTRSKDNEIRQASKQLLSILESPSLERPANWSIQLPTLKITTQTGNKYYKNKNKPRKEEKTLSPPTGPTRGMGPGFLSLVLAVLIVLTILLSGCVKITTKIDTPGPDRVKLSWEIENGSKKILPWQLKFEDLLTKSISHIEIKNTLQGRQEIQTPVVSSEEANLILQKTFATAAESAGIQISPPLLTLKERNWLIGVQQDFKLVMNLEGLKEIPGVELLILVNNPDNKKFIENLNLEIVDGEHSYWQVKLGEVNTIEFEQWTWNKTGIGAILILLFLGLTLFLQRLRLELGFGFPELPP